jgi:hypothetical protein
MVGVVDGDIVNVAAVGDVLGVVEGTAVGASVGVLRHDQNIGMSRSGKADQGRGSHLVGMEPRQSG